MMIRIASAAAIAALMSTAAFAQSMNPPPANAPMAQPAMPPATHMGSAKIMTSLPEGKTVTNFYKQDVYDPSDSKIGSVDDLLVSNEGRISAAVIGVGGFLGIGEKDVVVAFDALKLTQKNNKWYLTMNATKDELKSAPGFKYDRNTTTWMSDKAASNTAPTTNRAASR
jgi:hypothetical protein